MSPTSYQLLYPAMFGKISNFLEDLRKYEYHRKVEL